MQKRYALMEEELLSMVKTLKEFHTILLGQKIKIYTDDKSIACENFNTNNMLQWRPILE